MKWLFVFTSAVLSVSLSGLSFRQDMTNASFHVRSVHTEDAKDWCRTGECSARRITVEGYADVKGSPDTVEYVLDCVEVWANEPTPHQTIVCLHVHAREDYSVRIGDTFIWFGDPQKADKAEPILSAYSIFS